jgi:hypothetical protein
LASDAFSVVAGSSDVINMLDFETASPLSAPPLGASTGACDAALIDIVVVYV